MKIFFKNIEPRHLGKLSYPDGPDNAVMFGEPWLWVVHPPSSAKEFLIDVDYERAVKNCIDRGGGILFLKGTRLAGLDNEEEAVFLENQYNQRIHCLRVACSQNSPKIVERVNRFLKEIEVLIPGQSIPWEKVEPAPWPESLVAIYLLLKALESSPKDAEKIRSAWDELDLTWRQHLWAEAWREYNEDRSLGESDWLRAGLPQAGKQAVALPEPDLIPRAVDVIKQGLSGNG